MDTFNVETSALLASNMAQEASSMEIFPVLIGNEVASFHRVGGGYNKTRGFDIINLIHDVQSAGSPYRVDPEQASHAVEAHLSDNYYNLDVDSVRVRDDYPDRNYIMSLKVNDYQYGEHSFNKALSAPVDRRETRHE